MSGTARAEIGKLAFQDDVLAVRKTTVVTLKPLRAIVHSACAVGISKEPGQLNVWVSSAELGVKFGSPL
jgi:hypothetical protein